MVFRRSRSRSIIAQLAQDTTPAIEVNGQQCRNRPAHNLGAEGREIGRKTIRVDLEQPLGPRDVLQVVITKVAQTNIK